MAGLFWRLVAFEDGLDESASESLLVSTDTMTSFMPPDLSCEDSSSSAEKLEKTSWMWVQKERERERMNEWRKEWMDGRPCPWMCDTSRPSVSRRMTAPNCESKASLRRNTRKQVEKDNKAASRQVTTTGTRFQKENDDDDVKDRRTFFQL